MISIEQISGEIAALEAEKPTHVLMQKLAALYTVRDHITIPQESPAPVVAVSNTLPEAGISDFLQAVAGKGAESVLLILDELMDAVGVLNPALYQAVMRKVLDA